MHMCFREVIFYSFNPLRDVNIAVVQNLLRRVEGMLQGSYGRYFAFYGDQTVGEAENSGFLSKVMK